MRYLSIFLILFFLGCAADEEMDFSSNSSEEVSTSNSNNTSSNNSTSSSSNSDSVINQNFECGNGYYYLSRPEPLESDDTHEYFEYGWQSSPPVCVNVYQSELLEGRDEKLKISMDWLKSNLRNIIPINVFYIDQFNASEESKLQHDTDFCNLVSEPSELDDCIAGNADSWGDRSYGGGVYGKYLHKGADLMIYDDAFVQDEGEDSGLIYLAHEYFHTFQTGHMFYFEEKQKFGIRIEDEVNGVPLPFLPIWIGEGGANFASISLMAKQNLDFNHYEQAVRFLNQAREAMRGSNSSFSLENFESENTRINDEYYAYDGGFMAHVYLWHLNQDNFKKLMIDFYSVFAEKYRLNPTDGWKDAFEETFGLSLEDFYSDFDAFMRLDKESQVAIIKSADEWIISSWD
tara:strand:+ start:320 stop:1528 length:1209 start_codon:yes stop_codon:yes gene_type:complete